MESTQRLSRAAGWSRRAPRRAAWCMVALAAFVGLGSCGDAPSVPTIRLIIDVPAVPPGTTLEVRATLKNDSDPKGITDPEGIHITNNKTKFAVVVPNAAPYVGSTLELDAYVLDSTLCYQQTGSAIANLTDGVVYQELTMQLTQPTATPACQLTVDVTGSGTVLSTSPTNGAINCGKGNNNCSYGFPQGTMVTLQAPDDNTVYPVWSSNCAATNVGARSCTITISRGEQRVSAHLVPRSCSPGNWCQYNPYPVDFTTNSMWASSSMDVWAVGTGAQLMHYNGMGWSIATSPVDDTMTKVFGTSSSDVWALGSSSLVHYDGTRWTADIGSTIGNFDTGASVDAMNVYVSGDSGRIAYFNGSVWAQAANAPAALSAMVAKGAGDLWAVDVNGAAYHFDGKVLTQDQTLVLGAGGHYALYVASNGDIWAANSAAVDNPLWRYTQGAWSPVVPDSGIMLASGVNAIGGDSSNEVFVGTPDGQVLRFAGTAACAAASNCWSVVYKRPTNQMATPVRAVFATSATDIWVAGGFAEYVHSADAKTWTSTVPVTGSAQNQYSVWGVPVSVGTTPTILWSVGVATTYLPFDGTSVTTAQFGGKQNRAVYGASVSGQLEIWAVGDAGSVYRSTDGAKWSQLTSGPVPPPGGHNLTGVYIYSAGAANTRHYFVVAESGYVGHYDASKATPAWVAMTGCGTANLKAVHGVGLTSIYAVGAGGAMYSLDPTLDKCTQITNLGTTANLNGVFVDSMRAWVVGDANTLISYNPSNSTAKAFTTPTSTLKLNSVTSGVIGANSIVAVGDGGTILGCSATTSSCTAVQSGVSTNLNDIWAENSNDVWAVGDGGIILRMKM